MKPSMHFPSHTSSQRGYELRVAGPPSQLVASKLSSHAKKARKTSSSEPPSAKSHSYVRSPGQWVMTGAPKLVTAIVWVHSPTWPQESLARYVRVMTSGQELPSDTSPTCVTTTSPQPEAVTEPGFGDGTADGHAT